MSYLANRMHFFFPLLGIKRQRDPMEPKQWELIIKPNLLIPSRAYGSKDKLGWQDHMQKLKQKRFQLVLFPKSHSCKKWAVFLFFFFSLCSVWGPFFLVKYVWEVEVFKRADVCDCTLAACWETLLVISIKNAVIQSSTSHYSKLLLSVKEVINGVQQWHRLPPALASSLILMQLSYWSKQTNPGVQLALCLIKSYLTRQVVKEYCTCPQIQFCIL